MEFDEYQFVYLTANPEYKRPSEEVHKKFMAGHFEFINKQVELGNLFLASPLESGGLYFFNGDISKEKVNELLYSDDSIKNGVFLIDNKRMYVPKHHLIFTLENHKRILDFHKKNVNESKERVDNDN